MKVPEPPRQAQASQSPVQRQAPAQALNTEFVDAREGATNQIGLQMLMANSPRTQQLQTVQLRLKKWKPTQAPSSDKEKKAEEAANLVSDAVDTAYTETENNNLSDAGDAYAALYLLRLKEFAEKPSGKKTMHPSTAAGYVIESKVNNRLNGTAGMNFQNTALLSGTRPDVTIDLGDGYTALVDMTAQKSLGHIFNKKGNWTNHKTIPYVAEAWYPSMSFSGKAATLSQEQVKMAEEAADRKKELSELIEKETQQYKLEEFLEAQDTVLKKLVNAGSAVVKYLYGRKRDMAVIRRLGVDIGDDQGTVIKMTIEGRNKHVGRIGSALNPAPGFLTTEQIKALSIIKMAIRAAAPFSRRKNLHPGRKGPRKHR